MPPALMLTIRNTILALTFCALPLAAQTISNPSFETDTFTAFPGYISGNGAITGWTAGNNASAGINPGGGNPFADNGTVPNGSQVAFIQSGAGSSLSTVITGLTPGTAYTVACRVNARNGNNPLLRVGIDGTPVVDMDILAVGGANPYKYIAFDFMASAASHTMTLTNNQGGDNTVVLDDFTIAASNGRWSYAAWNGDSSSGVDDNYTYTHAYNFGSGASPVINGVPFTGVGGGSPVVSGQFSTAGLPNVLNGDGNNVNVSSAGSRALANDFLYGGPVESITLQGLVPGTEYVATIFSVGWEDGTRAATFNANGDLLTVNQDHFGNNNGVRVSYRYTADGSGSVTLTFTQLGSGGWHIYGFCNRLNTTNNNPWTYAAWNDDATSGIDSQYLYTYAASFNSAVNPVINGVAFRGVGGAAPSQPEAFAVFGPCCGFPNDANNVTGGSRQLANDFLYGGNPSLVQVTNLTPGTEYVLTIFGVAFDPPGNRWATFSAGGSSRLIDEDYFDNDNGIRISYRYTADASGGLTATITPFISANSFHLYGFANREAAPNTNRWSYALWVDDVTSGVVSTQVFTHAYNFASAVSPVINGITFTGVAGANPSVGGKFSTTGLPSGFNGDANNVAGGSRDLANDFLYGGAPETLTLNNLTPGRQYLLSLYTVGWEDSGRHVTFTAGADSITVDQDRYGGNNGLRLDYRYTADMSGTLTVTLTPLDPEGPGFRTLHLYGFANSVTNLPPLATNNVAGARRDTAASITAAKLLLNDFDPDGDAMSVTGVSASSAQGGTVSLSNPFVIYTPPSGFTGTDTFTYTVGDGRGATATATVTVTVFSGAALNVVSGPTYSGGSFHAGFAGIPGYTYTVEWSPNVDGPWTTLTNATAGTNGLFSIDDAVEPQPPSRFYRTSFP